jgi:hypothetical protein
MVLMQHVSHATGARDETSSIFFFKARIEMTPICMPVRCRDRHIDLDTNVGICGPGLRKPRQSKNQ